MKRLSEFTPQILRWIFAEPIIIYRL